MDCGVHHEVNERVRGHEVDRRLVRVVSCNIQIVCQHGLSLSGSLTSDGRLDRHAGFIKCY